MTKAVTKQVADVQAQGSKYKVEEFALKARALFGVSPECVITAFALAGVKEATEKDAEAMVKNFMKREVK